MRRVTVTASALHRVLRALERGEDATKQLLHLHDQVSENPGIGSSPIAVLREELNRSLAWEKRGVARMRSQLAVPGLAFKVVSDDGGTETKNTEATCTTK